MTWSIQTPGDEETNTLAESRTHIDLQENIHARLAWLHDVAQGTQMVESVEQVLEQFTALRVEAQQMYAVASAYQDGILNMKEQRDMALLDAHEAKTKGATLAKQEFANELAARYSLPERGAQRIIDYLFKDSDYVPSSYTERDLALVIEALDRDLLEEEIMMSTDYDPDDEDYETEEDLEDEGMTWTE